MGRFETTVDFYSRYREPYTPDFFRTVVHQLALTGQEALLDVGCGPGLLALGFAPYVAHCTGVDPEPAMISAATKAALNAHVPLALHHGRIEEFFSASRFDLITIGRVIHWLDRGVAIPKLEQLLALQGRILICGAQSVDHEQSPWFPLYRDIRRTWASEPEEARTRHDGTEWFAGSRFLKSAEIVLPEHRRVTIDELIGRSLSKSNTSPAILGDRRDAFEEEMREALRPFASNGELQEEIVARATIYELSTES